MALDEIERLQKRNADLQRRLKRAIQGAHTRDAEHMRSTLSAAVVKWENKNLRAEVERLKRVIVENAFPLPEERDEEEA